MRISTAFAPDTGKEQGMAKEYGELYPLGGDDEKWVLQTSPEPHMSVPLSDDDGNMRTWESELQALNDLAREGWELAATTSQSEADHPERILARLILSRNVTLWKRQ